MRRALLAAAVAVPLVALAITAGDGQVLDRTNFSSTHGNISYVNSAQCFGADALHLEWKITPLAGASFGQNDQVKVFASDTVPSQTNNGFCDEKPATTPTTINANQISVLQPATTLLADKDVSNAGTAINDAAKIDCRATGSEGRNVYICAHWYDVGGTTKKGLATGVFQIQVAAPNAPTSPLDVRAGDGKLFVSWSAPVGGDAAADRYVAEAYAPGMDPGNAAPNNVPASTATVTTTSAEIKGLANGTLYRVYVYALSVGGNPSGRLGFVEGTPAAAADFWDVYKNRGGTDPGGCASGSAGALALLGVASFLALRRRRP